MEMTGAVRGGTQFPGRLVDAETKTNPTGRRYQHYQGSGPVYCSRRKSPDFNLAAMFQGSVGGTNVQSTGRKLCVAIGHLRRRK
jgi:hypothetical protein